MRLSETERAINAYADGLELAGAAQPAAHLRSITSLLKEFGNRTIADLVEAGNQVRRQFGATPDPPAGPTVEETAAHLTALQQMLRASRASAAQVEDLGLLIGLLRSGNGSDSDSRYLGPMLNILRQALMPQKPEKAIREFVDRLKAETGSERFDQVLSELANSTLKKEHVVEVARAVYGAVPKKTSRKAALGFIRRPHDAYMSAKRGIDATRGRSAA